MPRAVGARSAERGAATTQSRAECDGARAPRSRGAQCGARSGLLPYLDTIETSHTLKKRAQTLVIAYIVQYLQCIVLTKN